MRLSRLQRAILTQLSWRTDTREGAVEWRPAAGCPRWSATARADVSRALRRLEARGLVQRPGAAAMPFGGRTVAVRLTERGWALALHVGAVVQ